MIDKGDVAGNDQSILTVVALISTVDQWQLQSLLTQVRPAELLGRCALEFLFQAIEIILWILLPVGSRQDIILVSVG